MNAFILAFIAALLFGASAPFGKMLLQSIPPFQMAGLLYLGAALAVLPTLLLNRQGQSLQLNRQRVLRLSGSLVFGGIFAPVLLMMALSRASAASTSLWLSLEAPFTALGAYLLFKEHLGWRGVLAVIGATAAAVMLSFSEGVSGGVAAVLAAGACICWAIDNNLTAIVDGVTAEQLTFAKGIVAGTLNLTLGCIFAPVALDLQHASLALLLGALSYGISLVCYITAAQKLGAIRSQAIFAGAPFFGVFLACLILKEQFQPIQIAAGITLLISILLLFKDTHSHEHAHEAMSHIHEHSHDDDHHNHLHSELNPGEVESSVIDANAPELVGAKSHSHWHTHESMRHSHPHWPDLHHRHGHEHS